MPRPRSAITLTPVWRGDKIDIHVDGQIANVPAPADGIHVVLPESCHFFVGARELWDELDKLLDGPRKPKRL